MPAVRGSGEDVVEKAAGPEGIDGQGGRRAGESGPSRYPAVFGRSVLAVALLATFGLGGLWGASSWTEDDRRPFPGEEAAGALPAEPSPTVRPVAEEAEPDRAWEPVAEMLAAAPVPIAPALPEPMPAAPQAEPSAPPDEAPAAETEAPAVAVSALPPPPARESAGQDRPLWLRNAVPLAWDRRRPAIAVVIDDLGVDRRRSARVVGLPGPLTLAWLPYAREVGRQTAAARAAGHELLLHMPMEPRGKQDPGPGAMLTSLGEPELRRRLDAAFASFEGYIGLNNHMGSRFTEDRRGMELVTTELRRRGLMFLDSVTTAHSVGLTAARKAAVPTIGRDVFIDHDMRPESVTAALARIEAVARRKGWAIGIGHPHDVTIEALARWLPTLEERGFSLVPVSAIVRALDAGKTDQGSTETRSDDDDDVQG